MTDNVTASAFNVNDDVTGGFFQPVIFGTLQVTKVLSTEEVKRAIEGPGKDFGKSIYYDDSSDIKLPLDRLENPVCLWQENTSFFQLYTVNLWI